MPSNKYKSAIHRYARLNEKKEIRPANLDDEQLSMLSEYVINDWLSTNAEVQKEIQPYLQFRDKIVIIDGVAIKGKRIIVPALL